MGTFCLESKNKMKAVFASALVAAATALPWEDSQLIMWSEPSVNYGVRGVSYDVSIPSNSETNGNPTNWPIPGRDYKCYNWGAGRGFCKVKVDGKIKYTKWGENGDNGSEAANTSQLNEFCSYWSVYRPDGEGSSALEHNALGDQCDNVTWEQGPNDNQWDAVQSATKSTFCKACFGGDHVQTTTKFCKSCFGGDVESTARFCKACFGGDDAEVKARFCKACFGGDDVATTVAFCKSCFGGDDAEVKARFCKSCFGGDVETHARFCKSCFGGDDAEVHSRFCKSCFGGDVEARVKCDCSNDANKNESHYGLSDFILGKLKDMMSKSYSILAAAHELGVDPDACECALGTDSTTKHYLPGGGLAYDKLLASTHDQMIMSYAIPQYSFAQF